MAAMSSSPNDLELQVSSSGSDSESGLGETKNSVRVQETNSHKPSTSSAAPAKVLLDLPNEILHTIFVQMEDLSAYFNLGRTNHHLHNVSIGRATQKQFTKTWFAEHCNDEFGKAPALIEFIARLIRFLNDPERIERLYDPEVQWRMQVYSWLRGMLDGNYVILSDLHHAICPDTCILPPSTPWGEGICSVQKQWVAAHLTRVRASVVSIPKEQRPQTFEAVQLDIVDVKFAERLYKVYRYFEGFHLEELERKGLPMPESTKCNPGYCSAALFEAFEEVTHWNWNASCYAT
ncbi:hypothetical protein BJ508DRAFT_310836 [Ascobolus immersus RN42]|uniref:F-box domain-containing protein n=1 Tax=Ascobolus immersus RN42 TaxID=1160509 RepID=A0A3N4I4D6_ASCIM|nr:hypothetical protein BJ508DRAFT_310836 [Ascobolus immersus RN42]